jgi:large subunit ribosomal protein L9
VAETLKEKGIEIDKKNIEMKQIKTVGEYEVDVKLGHGIHAKLKLIVEGE